MGVFLMWSFLASGQSNFNGEWNLSTKSSDFSLTLNQTNSKSITGQHCSVMYNGDRIDCATDGEKTISGTIQGDSIIVTFMSEYSMTKGKAVIKKVNDKQISWRVIQSPKGIYYIPDEVILTKE